MLRSGALLLAIYATVSLAHFNIRDLRARFHPQTNTIVVEWSFPPPHTNVQFNVRHRWNGDEAWKSIVVRDTMALLTRAGLRDGDELHVQVNAERGGHIIEDWSPVLIITVSKKPPSSDSAGGLVPPLNFQATILDTTSVRLEWTSIGQKGPDGQDIYYIVNVKQLTTKSGGVLQRQQIKTSESSFTMGRLIPGERYELTIRSATADTRVSNTAAIVEITMPKDEEFFEIGNLLISSYFRPNGVGTVNLTWDIPPHMVQRVIGYNVQYALAGTEDWQAINFTGPQSSATLDLLKSDQEYALKIKTLLQHGIATESGIFNFRTPKVQQNPIRKVDVIYSHDVNSVRLQWMLEPHISMESVAGYDVFYSDNKDLPEAQWRYVRLDTREASLAIPNLRSLTTYFVRVNIRHRDGTITRPPSLYRFKTIDWSNARGGPDPFSE